MNLLLYSKFMSFKLCWVLCANSDFLICLIFFPFIFLPKSQIFQRRERIQYAEALSGFCAKKKRIFSLWNLAQDGCRASLEECTNVKADPLSFQDNREQTERGSEAISLFECNSTEQKFLLESLELQQNRTVNTNNVICRYNKFIWEWM